MTVVAQKKVFENWVFESWYQQTLAPVAKQLGFLVEDGKKMTKQLLETEFEFEFVGDEISKIILSKQNASFNKERAEA